MTDDYKTISENVRALEHNCDKIKKEISSLKLHRIKEYGILPEKVGNYFSIGDFAFRLGSRRNMTI